MNQIPNYVLKIKKIYDIIIPTGKIIQDIDKDHKISYGLTNKRISKPTIKEIPAVIGILAWMFMIKYLLDFLGIAGEIIFFIFIPLSALSHLIGEMNDFSKEDDFKNREFPKTRIIEIFLLQIIYLGIGFFSLRGFVGHLILANTVAVDIGWQIGSLFQTELAFYHLGFGVTAIISLWKRDSIWIGLIIAKSIFLFGAAGVHIWDIIVNQNFSHGNTGTILYLNDLALPVLSIFLLWLYYYFQKKNNNNIISYQLRN